MLFAYYVYYFENVSMCCSIFMTMALTFERYLAMISLPIIPRNYSNCLQWVKMLLLCVFPVVIFSMLFNIPKFLEFEVLESELDGEYQNSTVYYIKPTELRLNYNYILGIQSFTSLNAELHQDINGGTAFNRCLNGTFP